MQFTTTILAPPTSLSPEYIDEATCSHAYWICIYGSPPEHEVLSRMRVDPSLTLEQREEFCTQLSKEELTILHPHMVGLEVIRHHEGNDLSEDAPFTGTSGGRRTHGIVIASRQDPGSGDVELLLRPYQCTHGRWMVSLLEGGVMNGFSLQHVRYGKNVQLREISICVEGKRPNSTLRNIVQLHDAPALAQKCRLYQHPSFYISTANSEPNKHRKPHTKTIDVTVKTQKINTTQKFTIPPTHVGHNHSMNNIETSRASATPAQPPTALAQTLQGVPGAQKMHHNMQPGTPVVQQPGGTTKNDRVDSVMGTSTSSSSNSSSSSSPVASASSSSTSGGAPPLPPTPQTATTDLPTNPQSHEANELKQVLARASAYYSGLSPAEQAKSGPLLGAMTTMLGEYRRQTEANKKLLEEKKILQSKAAKVQADTAEKLAMAADDISSMIMACTDADEKTARDCHEIVQQVFGAVREQGALDQMDQQNIQSFCHLVSRASANLKQRNPKSAAAPLRAPVASLASAEVAPETQKIQQCWQGFQQMMNDTFPVASVASVASAPSSLASFPQPNTQPSLSKRPVLVVDPLVEKAHQRPSKRAAPQPSNNLRDMFESDWGKRPRIMDQQQLDFGQVSADPGVYSSMWQMPSSNR